MKFYALPSLSYQPDTRYAAGFSGGYYFHFIDPVRISSLEFSAVFTQRGQFNITLNPHLYWGKRGSWFLSSSFNIKSYPNYFVGIGNNPNKLFLHHPIPYTSRSFSLNIQPQRYLTRRLLFGLQFSFQRERALLADSLKGRAYSVQSTGWSPYSMIGIGGELTYDSRSSRYYPLSGIYSKVSFLYCDPLWGSSHHIVQLGYDFRQYISLYKENVLAWQFLTDSRLGDAIPFQFLTTIGGENMLRGFTPGVFRDNVMAATQAEYRFPVYKNFRGALFGATGDVFNSKTFSIYRLKISYGAGIRFRVTKANVNFRFDVTHNNYYKGVQYYLTTIDAF
ncbi:BamA/TamA family outer membrane protein [Microbacter margulisiae]|uniref:Outer membrane protein assembly factor BamA n=1 Tax=Microbacter margulisiae TaxID=1350067 RepID=A0A7W5DTU4_9PORP|nr:BamA/TamA family outer membrane protein [Microbacter margulisiae]MBB3188580.1 outer membrane protein assembly factor BamA [Microbacter margulisiae]